MPLVILENVTKVFGKGDDAFTAVDHLNLEVKKGELVVLIGPSGCGKSTTLKMINRLIEPTSGRIVVNGQDTARMNRVQLRRDIGYVIQDIGLFPHMTIEQNVSIVPKLLGWNKARRRQRTEELLSMVSLDPEIYRHRYPAELSGGQQQRIGVLRALAAEPDLILMDEPFGALDPITREQLQDELKELNKKVKKTIVFVTHDIDEAIKLADKIVLMRNGKIVQMAPPDEMLKNPADQFVRDFIGEERLTPRPDTTPVSDIMIPNPKTITLDFSLKQALGKMQETAADVLVVVDDKGKAEGIITADDLQSRIQKGSHEGLVPRKVKVVHSSTSVRDAAEQLVESGQRIVVIADQNGKPVGLMTRASLLKQVVSVFWSSGNGQRQNGDAARTS